MLLTSTLLAAGVGALLWTGTDAGITALALAATTACLAAMGFLPAARYRAWSYQLRERDLVLRRGVLWHAVSVVPHSRIQHVDTRRGPLERWLGLARVVIYTAGSVGGALTIPGLAATDAEALRDHLATIGGGDDAV